VTKYNINDCALLTASQRYLGRHIGIAAISNEAASVLEALPFQLSHAIRGGTRASLAKKPD
jgi:hypothetical protein